MNAVPTTTSLLRVLHKDRLIELGRIYSLALSPKENKDDQIKTLIDSGFLAFRYVIRHMTRDELKAACRSHGLSDSSRARLDLAQRLLEAHGNEETQPLPQLFMGTSEERLFPKKGDIVSLRHRQWLVEKIAPAPDPTQASLISLVCLDDDNQGRRLDVLWELELGAKVLQPEAHGLGDISKIDPPRFFAAYLHALKWNAVTATEAHLFQSPFRAGIKLLNHQLIPLKKALELPRANLFIADDVGLGKTIEAGLVLQELLLRQQVELALIVCPASVTLQWRDEMAKRFGLHFELYNREFVGRRRRERGFGVNPWRTHQRFIISYQTLRRPEYQDLLLERLGAKARKSLLIIDEAHTVAPASGNQYIKRDSQVTKLARKVAPLFENRLFLSATPHNGHSTSFSALLEILDPQRFTRGVPISGVDELRPVMVRRLKSDLREVNIEFPRRDVVQVNLQNQNNAWSASYVHLEEKKWVLRPNEKDLLLGPGKPIEILLAEKLARYTTLMKPDKGPGQLVFMQLQKRLLSSVEAFARTLALHARSIGEGRAKTSLQLKLDLDADDYGADDDLLEEVAAAESEDASRVLTSPEGEARRLLEEMVRLAEDYRSQPDAKVLALLDWIRRNQNPAVVAGGTRGKSKNAEWSDQRVIIFTEFGATKSHLQKLLGAAIEGTKLADQRISVFHGGMSDAQREAVQAAFNGDPKEHPVRILIATDAAREGVNLQGRCADLFHFDVPWNPGRMEQRNGRIDRTLQPSSEVRCHYFFYPQRTEDVVLKKLVEKVETIQEELGSLGTVVMDRFEQILESGIESKTNEALVEAEHVGSKKETAAAELEAQRLDKKQLAAEIEEAGKILNNSARIMDFDPVLLRDAIDVGLELAGAGRLQPIDGQAKSEPEAFALPSLGDNWQATLDSLRRPRRRDEQFWDWRKTAPEPVVFRPPERIQSGKVHLHLEHPFTKRVLDRFRAQGYSAHDLSRVTIVKNRRDALVRVIAFGRLSLFGPGATRLHDRLISVAAQWRETGGEGHLRPFADAADRRALDALEQILKESPSLEGISRTVQDKLARSAPSDFAKLWAHIQVEADAHAHESALKLEARGRAEAEALRTILRNQRLGIEASIKRSTQLRLELEQGDREEREQFEQDQKHLSERHIANTRELHTEPKEIEAIYNVSVKRLEPVGLVYLWPETRG